MSETSPSGPTWEAAQAECNWLHYRIGAQPVDGSKPSKVPVKDGRACDRDKAAFMTYEEATASLPPEGHGIGYLPREGSAMVVLDLDKVLDEESSWVEAEHKRLFTGESYTEFSVSGTGLHVLLPREGWPTTTIDTSTEPVGLHASGKVFIAVTEEHVEGSPRAVQAAPELMAMVLPDLERRIAERASVQSERKASDADGSWFDPLPPERQVELVIEMLDALPERWCKDRDRWLDVTFSLRGYPHLFDIWDAWSRDGGSHYDAAGNEEVWYGREREGETRGIGSLIHEAEGFGADLGHKAKRISPEQGARMLKRLQAVRPDVATQAEEAGDEEDAMQEARDLIQGLLGLGEVA